MKVKLLLSIATIAAIQTVSAARLEIVNESGKPQIVNAYYGGENASKQIFIRNNSSETVDSGVHAFKFINWHDEQHRQGKGGECYGTDIPSSRTMLMGTIMLRDRGNFDINFDSNGSSTHKLRSGEARRCSW